MTMKGKKHSEETKKKIRNSLLGNTNAEKWTEETVFEKLSEMSEVLIEDSKKEDIKEVKFIYVGTLLFHFGLNQQIWSEWRNKFEENKTISDIIKNIDEYFEQRLFTLAAKNKLNSAVSIFGLKNTHKWVDKHEITGENGQPLSFVFNIIDADGTTEEEEESEGN